MARATALQAVGHRFKSCPAYQLGTFYGLVAQFGLARLPVTQEVAGSSPVGPVSTLPNEPHVVLYNAVAFSLHDAATYTSRF